MIVLIRLAILTCLAHCFSLPGSCFAEPALEYRFNGSGSSFDNSGSFGKGGDLTYFDAVGTPAKNGKEGAENPPGGCSVLDLTSANGMGNDFVGPYARSEQAGAVFNEAKSFSICGWYNAVTPPANGARLLQSGMLILFFSDGLVLQTGIEGALDSVASKGYFTGGEQIGEFKNPLAYDEANVWKFFAVTFLKERDKTTVTFYEGGTTPSKRLASTSMTYKPSASVLGNVEKLFIGGNHEENIRPFDGSLAEIRVFVSTNGPKGALDERAIDQLRVATLKKK